MIEVVEDQINDLFKEEKNKNGEKTGKINQELLNEASETAINRGSDWDDLSYVNNMMIDVKMEKLKTNEEGKKRSIHKIAEMYRIRKNMLITQIVTYQEQLEKEGRISFEKGSGNMIVLDKTLIEDRENSESQTDEIMEEMEEDARDTAMQENYDDKSVEMVDLTEDDIKTDNNGKTMVSAANITQESQTNTQTYEQTPSNKKKKLTHNNTEDKTRTTMLYSEATVPGDGNHTEAGDEEEIKMKFGYIYSLKQKMYMD